jgi:hypothetical protein
LSRFKVAICTSSIYGYSLRKIIEATACGCRVITDLPIDDVLPEIDDNLVRLTATEPEQQLEEVAALLPELTQHYDADFQYRMAFLAKQRYSYQEVGRRLAADIEKLRNNYTASPQ